MMWLQYCLVITQNLYHLLRNVGDGKDKSLHLSFDGRNISLAVMSAQNIWDTLRVTICNTVVTICYMYICG